MSSNRKRGGSLTEKARLTGAAAELDLFLHGRWLMAQPMDMPKDLQ